MTIDDELLLSSLLARIGCSESNKKQKPVCKIVTHHMLLFGTKQKI